MKGLRALPFGPDCNVIANVHSPDWQFVGEGIQSVRRIQRECLREAVQHGGACTVLGGGSTLGLQLAEVRS